MFKVEVVMRVNVNNFKDSMEEVFSKYGSKIIDVQYSFSCTGDTDVYTAMITYEDENSD